MARSGPWTPDWNARTRRRGTQATLNTIWPGSFVWLPWPYDERVLRSQAVNEVSEGRFNHPFVVLAVDERSEKATILMVRLTLRFVSLANRRRLQH